jgi:hypothetical protein
MGIKPWPPCTAIFESFLGASVPVLDFGSASASAESLFGDLGKNNSAESWFS